MVDYLPAIAQINKQDRFDAITAVLNTNGIPYAVQTFSGFNVLGNIIVTFNPESTEPKTVVSAHYDNAPGTPGANDNAAACSILLNLILAAKEKGTKVHLEFVFFDLEECGFKGSENYLEYNWYRLHIVYNLDMCGMGNNTVVACDYNARIMIAAHLGSVVEVDKLPSGDADTFFEVLTPTVYVVSATDRDVDWFRTYAKDERRANWMPDFARTMHRPGDTPDTCNRAHMEEIYVWLRGCLGI